MCQVGCVRCGSVGLLDMSVKYDFFSRGFVIILKCSDRIYKVDGKVPTDRCELFRHSGACQWFGLTEGLEKGRARKKGTL